MFTNIAKIRAGVRRTAIALTAVAAAATTVALAAPGAEASPSPGASRSFTFTVPASPSWGFAVAGNDMPYLGYDFVGYSSTYSISVSCSDGRSWVGLPAFLSSGPSTTRTSYQWQIGSTTTGSQGSLGSEAAGRSCTFTTYAPAGRLINVAPVEANFFQSSPGTQWRNFLGSYVIQTGSGAGGSY